MSSIIQAAHLELFHEGGFGGRIFKTVEFDDQKSYLIKCDRYCRYFMEKAGTVDEKNISAAASTVLDRIASLNLQNMRGCFQKKAGITPALQKYLGDSGQTSRLPT